MASLNRVVANVGSSFFTPGDAADPEYTFVRDRPDWIEQRAAIEERWRGFRHLCGDGERAFLIDARTHARERLWEMQVACMMLAHQHNLERPPKDAPDVLCKLAAGTVWVEATVPGRGSGADAVEPDREGLVHIDRDRMMLRYTNALHAKLAQFGEFRKRLAYGAKLIDDDHAYVVAINSSSIPYSEIENGVPDIVRTVFGAGRRQYTVPVLGSKGPVEADGRCS
jgi:hypothetical protein